MTSTLWHCSEVSVTQSLCIRNLFRCNSATRAKRRPIKRHTYMQDGWQSGGSAVECKLQLPRWSDRAPPDDGRTPARNHPIGLIKLHLVEVGLNQIIIIIHGKHKTRTIFNKITYPKLVRSMDFVSYYFILTRLFAILTIVVLIGRNN